MPLQGTRDLGIYGAFRDVAGVCRERGYAMLGRGALSLAAALLCGTTAAWAQLPPPPGTPEPALAPRADTDPRQDVLQRLESDLAPAGLRVGSMVLNPQLRAGVTYDDNIFATRNNKKSDFIGNVGAGLRARSDLPRHAFGMLVDLDGNKFADNEDEDFWHGNVEASGRFDIERETNVGGNLAVRRLTDPRDSPDDLNGTEPSVYRLYQGSAFAQTGGASITSRLEAGVNRLEYDDVETSTGTLNTAERERDEFFANGTVGYRYLGAEQVYVRGQVNERNYRRAEDNSGFRRDSQGYRAEVGATFALGPLIFGDFAVGYQQQDYDDARFGSPGQLVYSGGLLWSPTRLTSVRLEARSEFAESFNTGSPGYWRDLYTLTVAHEIRNNLVGFVRGVYTERDFETISREDEVYGGDLGVVYRLDRGLFIDGEYRYRESDSSGQGAGAGYSRNLALVRLRRTF